MDKPVKKDMTFTCYPITDGDYYNGKTIGWAVAGDEKVFCRGYLSQAKEDVLRQYPLASFIEDCIVIEEFETPILILGKLELLKWRQAGSPNFEMIDGKPVCEK